MGKILTIRLESNDLGQLLDGLRSRAEAWHRTAEYLETGCTDDRDFIVEECSDVEEARAIAAHFHRIIALIRAQVKEQGTEL